MNFEFAKTVIVTCLYYKTYFFELNKSNYELLILVSLRSVNESANSNTILNFPLVALNGVCSITMVENLHNMFHIINL